MPPKKGKKAAAGPPAPPVEEEKKADAVEALPTGPTPEELQKQLLDEALKTRIDTVLDSFASDDGGTKIIEYEEVGHAIRGCGCYIPECVLVENILPAITEPQMKVVRLSLLADKVFTMIKERTWEADTEADLLKVFRFVDRHAHNGEEFGYIEADKMEAFMTKHGFTPLRREEQEAFASYSNDTTGRRIYYHDYIGTLLPFLEDEEYLSTTKPKTNHDF